MVRWGRKIRETAQPKLLGLDLNKKRNTTILLITGTILTSFILLSRYHQEIGLTSTSNSIRKGIGRQAYELAFHSTIPHTSSSSSSSSDTSDSNTNDDNELFNDLVWNLPEHSTWDPLLPDKRPITHMSMNFCFSSPRIWDVCSPASSLKEDQERGKWIRVDKDINKGIGLTFNYLYIRRLQPNSRLPVMTKITLVTGDEIDVDPTIDDKTLGDWNEVAGDLRIGLWPRLPKMYLRFRTNTQSQIKESKGTLEPITEVDVLYGSQVVKPLYGFERVLPLITGGEDDDKALGVGGIKGTSRAGTGLAIRKAIPVLPPTPSLTFSPSGKFTILQVADLHFSVGPGECHDVDTAQAAACKAIGSDLYSLQWLERAINFTSPNLIILSGDQLNGQGTSWNSQSTILKWASVLWEKKIAWTVIFGNHDEEIDLSNKDQMKLLRTFPYFVGEEGPESADGVGNYMRSIRSGDAHNATLFNLYFLDSHAYAKTLNPWTKKAAYDWLKPGQINWFRSQSSKVSPILRPYSPSAISPPSKMYSLPSTFKNSRAIPIADNVITETVAVMPDDGAQVDDYGSLNDGEVGDEEQFEPINKVGITSSGSSNSKTVISPDLPIGPTIAKPMMAKPNAMIFFHIPLPESYTSIVDVGPTGMNLQSGERKEGSGAPKKNSGFFKEAILAQGEIVEEGVEGKTMADEFWEGEFTKPTKGRSEVKIVGNGHCHLSEDCRRVNGVWLCFGGGGSYSGYGKPGFDRRMRVYDISSFGEVVATHHVLDQIDEELSRVGEIILVGEEAFGMQ